MATHAITATITAIAAIITVIDVTIGIDVDRRIDASIVGRPRLGDTRLLHPSSTALPWAMGHRPAWAMGSHLLVMGHLQDIRDIRILQRAPMATHHLGIHHLAVMGLHHLGILLRLVIHLLRLILRQATLPIHTLGMVDMLPLLPIMDTQFRQMLTN